MKLHLSLKILILMCLGLSSAWAAVDENPPLVEVEVMQDTLAPYQERRDDYGWYFGLNYEALDLKNYVSVLDNTNRTYSEVFGDNPIPLIRLSFDYKYNTSLGSIAAGLGAAIGSLESNKSGSTHKLEVMQYAVELKWTFDTLWAEPYIAPYLGLNLWQMGLKETSIKDNVQTDSFSVTTQLGYNYIVGFLFQLDWMDHDSAKTSTFSWGMENAFLDVYATQYAKTTSEDDPNTETDWSYGAGLRLEY